MSMEGVICCMVAHNLQGSAEETGKIAHTLEHEVSWIRQHHWHVCMFHLEH